MRTIFTEKQLEDSITNDGYVVIDLLTPDELEQVQNIIKKLGYGRNNEAKLWFSTTQESVERKNVIYEACYPVLRTAVDRYVEEHKLVRIVIIDKFPGGGPVKVHQHPNRVDESKYRSLTGWIPLVDTNVEMGTLHVVKCSHNVFVHHIRPYNDFSIFHNISPRVLKRYSTPLLLRAGQAAIFDDRLIHWSPPNKTNISRTVVQFDLLPYEIVEDLSIYYRNNEDELSRYKIKPRTFRESALSHKKPDDLIIIESKKQPKFRYNNRHFIRIMKTIHTENKNKHSNFFQRFFH